MWNSKLDVYRTEWLDLVFANRNKSYGAYDLRQHNNQTTIKALFTASGLMVSMVMMLFLYSKLNKFVAVPDIEQATERIINISNIAKPKIPEQIPLKIEQSVKKPVHIQTRKFVNLRVVSANNITEEPVSIEDLKESIIGPQNVEGPLGAQQLETSPSNGNEQGNNIEASSGDEVVLIDFLEKYPEFPGGQHAFAKYLGKNLKYPYEAVENNITGRVIVSFIIERNGDLSDIKVLRGIGGGCDEEAVRVLKNAPAWTPGMQNGKAVRVAYTMPIYFQLGH